MKITLCLDNNIQNGKYISFEGKNNLFFNSFEEYRVNNFIDIFNALGGLMVKLQIEEEVQNCTGLDIFLGRSEKILISGGEKFKNIEKININGRGDSLDTLKVFDTEKSLEVTRCTINNVILEKIFGVIKIKDCIEINTIKISGKGKELYLEDITIHKILTVTGLNSINDFTLKNISFFSDTDGSAIFDIYGSTIGRFGFEQSIIPKDGLTIANSHISKAYFYKTNLEKLKLIGVTGEGFGNLEEDKNKVSEIKEFYRQLKHSHDEIGNKTEANKFFAKEMEYYRKSLLDNYSWRTFFDMGIGQKRVVCWYNQLTNDFGNSWIRPIVIMVLLAGVATFYDFLNSTSNFNWNTQILSNILPISEIGKFTTWFDFLYQITWAALIYQFIIALRRISQR